MTTAAEKRERYASDPEFRERELTRQREKYASDPEYRRRKLAQKRAKYASDPEYREKVRERGSRRIHTPSGERITLPDARTVEFARAMRDDYYAARL